MLFVTIIFYAIIHCLYSVSSLYISSENMEGLADCFFQKWHQQYLPFHTFLQFYFDSRLLEGWGLCLLPLNLDWTLSALPNKLRYKRCRMISKEKSQKFQALPLYFLGLVILEKKQLLHKQSDCTETTRLS